MSAVSEEAVKQAAAHLGGMGVIAAGAMLLAYMVFDRMLIQFVAMTDRLGAIASDVQAIRRNVETRGIPARHTGSKGESVSET
jgi:hypothetical protein